MNGHSIDKVFFPSVSISDIQLTYYSHYNMFVYPVYPVISVFSGQICLQRAVKKEQTPKPLLQHSLCEQPNWLTGAPKGSRGTLERFAALPPEACSWRKGMEVEGWMDM